MCGNWLAGVGAGNGEHFVYFIDKAVNFVDKALVFDDITLVLVDITLVFVDISIYFVDMTLTSTAKKPLDNPLMAS
ncbi:hypothetical protein ACFCYN_10820 [Gottfriedia sp. NPDC056225]|uniref:hypothetical protein n=1 Tax=Gottfriedia sp. NPDC056225 TaxID=3345751 RepID=UPI0035D5BC5F